ncbi:MAG: hypothetical protein GKS00_08445 [Alphaproteobacteria bacterium]|nr:hypothetical protein [Alphaproteobacteria bacterium]
MARTIYALLPLALILLMGLPGNVDAAVELKVTDFKCSGSKSERGSKTVDGTTLDTCRIGDRVTAVVSKSNLDKWLAAPPKKHTLEKLVLALDGQLLVGSHARLTDKGLSFELVRKQDNTSNMAAWKSLLARTELFEPKKMTIAVALEGTAERYGQKDVWIQVASHSRLGIVIISYVVLVWVFLWLVFRKGLLRDSGPNPETGQKPFSLGYAQTAFWFFIVIGGFLYVWLVAGDLAVLTPGVLGLIGISAATGLVATSVAASKQTGVPAELSKLEQEKSELDSRLAIIAQEIQASTAAGIPPALSSEQAQKNKRRAVVDAKISDLTSVPASVGFFQDILSSGGEVSLPRFQMMGWTLVLGIVFVHSVFTTLNMPEFDETLLGLMGLSSGTYVGFKFPSKTGK